MRKNIFYFIYLLIGIFIFQWVYNFFAGPESIDLIIENKFKLIFVVIAHVPTLFFDSLAWVCLMSKNRLTILQALNITWIAQTSGKFIPTGNITGEFIRFYLAKKSGQRFVDSSSTIIVLIFIIGYLLRQTVIALINELIDLIEYSIFGCSNNLFFF